MKTSSFLLSMLLFFNLSVHAQGYVPTEDNLAQRRQFANDRFGVFLHWGLYSLFAQGEWYLQNAGIDRLEYAKSANAFYPHSFDAHAWVKAVKASGAKYITLTSRHHDGFSLWPTAYSDYHVGHTPYGKDVIAQLAEACEKEGIALHLYYSHIDWTREDYPAGRTGLRTGKDPQKADWKTYYRFMNNQLTELLTCYPSVRCIWFDGWWDHDSDSTAFDWQLPQQYKMIHQLKPSCLIGNNHHQVPFDGEDIQIFERDVPGENKAGLSGQQISKLPLETCETMNGMWGYKVQDQNYKSVDTLVALLVRTAAKGANLLLNVGPQPDGNLPAAALDRLAGMGKWLGMYGETIYGTEAGGMTMGNDVVSTRKNKEIYLHVLSRDLQHVDIACAEKVKWVKSFADGKRLAFKQKKGQLQFSLPASTDNNHRIMVIGLR